MVTSWTYQWIFSSLTEDNITASKTVVSIISYTAQWTRDLTVHYSSGVLSGIAAVHLMKRARTEIGMIPATSSRNTA